MNRVWVVDDTIPIHELYTGPFPSRLEAELVRHLAQQRPDAWEEPEVLELCRTLCEPDYDAVFFLSPEAMLRAFEQDAIPPHAVIFDWEYPGSDNSKNRAALEQLLRTSFAYVQVYTHLGEEGVEPHLADLREKYRGRLLPTRAKANVTPPDLAEEIRKAWAGTMAGELADRVRKQVFGAVERSLIEMCSISRGAIAAMTQGTTDNLLHIVLSKIRDEIDTCGFEVFEEIVGTSYAGDSSDNLRRLMSVWYYSFPSDNRVRRGDLIEVDGELGFVVTPSCDLARFPKKTGRRLTWLRCVRFDQEGLGRLRYTGYELNKVGNSIIAGHGGAGEAIVVLPNVPEIYGKRDAVADYILLCHAWENRLFADAPGGTLTYDHLSGMKRRCTVADPFASAIVARVTGVISSPGMPDLPKGEGLRLNEKAAANLPTTNTQTGVKK